MKGDRAGWLNKVEVVGSEVDLSSEGACFLVTLAMIIDAIHERL